MLCNDYFTQSKDVVYPCDWFAAKSIRSREPRKYFYHAYIGWFTVTGDQLQLDFVRRRASWVNNFMYIVYINVY